VELSKYSPNKTLFLSFDKAFSFKLLGLGIWRSIFLLACFTHIYPWSLSVPIYPSGYRHLSILIQAVNIQLKKELILLKIYWTEFLTRILRLYELGYYNFQNEFFCIFHFLFSFKLTAYGWIVISEAKIFATCFI